MMNPESLSLSTWLRSSTLRRRVQHGIFWISKRSERHTRVESGRIGCREWRNSFVSWFMTLTLNALRRESRDSSIEDAGAQVAVAAIADDAHHHVVGRLRRHGEI